MPHDPSLRQPPSVTPTATIRHLDRVLIANRGEIARRVIATCRRLGIETVAVCSDADSSASFVREADFAVGLPGAAAADTYLRGDLIVAAARQAGADAVHPGYGFLSENADFARAVMDAGLTWIGPEPDSIAAMGSKVRAKELMRAAGVPVLGAEGELDAPDYPVLVKASAGGGGRGMRIVREPAELESALAAASAEAESAFGDPTVFVEPYLDQARHIEVQVLADRHGTCWTLGERDCSIQRRHQKIVEESPAPGIADELRSALHGAARDAAKAIGYVGAGTVEFLVSVDPADGFGRPYFLEMNTRLQVEHPITECVTGLDLVGWQLRIAEGARLPPEPPTPQGHAIEVRLYAEDPADDWRPQTGLIRALDVPGVDVRFGVLGSGVQGGGDAAPVDMGHGLRLDSGVEAGDSIGVHYDPMLAKLIAWAPTRAEATRRLASGLRRARIHGVTTNRDLLVRILTDSEFAAGGVRTSLLAERLAEWSPPLLDRDQRLRAAVAAALAQATAAQAAARVQSRIPSGWRALASQPQRVRFGAGAVAGAGGVASAGGVAGAGGVVDADDTDVAVAYSTDRDRFVVHDPTGVVVHDVGSDRVTLTHEGVRETYSVASYPDGVVVVDGPHGSVTLTRRPRFTDPADQGTAPGSLLAPMPGVVTRIHVGAGEQVAAGAPVMTLEAMKMQHQIRAPIDGVVAEISTRQGAQVDSGMILAVVDPDPEELSAPRGPRGQMRADNSAVAQEDPT